MPSNDKATGLFESSGELQDSGLAKVRAQDLEADWELGFCSSTGN